MPTIGILPLELQYQIWDHVDTPREPAAHKVTETDSRSVNPTLQATRDRINLAKTCTEHQKINASWEQSKVKQKMQAWVKAVSVDKVTRAIADSGGGVAPEDVEEVTKQVRAFFDEIRDDPTFNENIKYYVLKDRARRESTDDHPLDHHGKNLAGYVPKPEDEQKKPIPYDTHGKSKYITHCAGFSGSTQLFGKTADLGEGKAKLQILLGYNMSHFGATGAWEMSIISSEKALEEKNSG